MLGGEDAEILLLGLAPGRFGSNRTGRMFTGDASGDFMFPILHEVGIASQPNSVDVGDGMKLVKTAISAVGRCAPPQNKPTPKELVTCRPFWREEISLLKNLKVVVALGKIAHDEFARMKISKEGGKMRDSPFAHGAVHHFKSAPHILLDTYHPSRQNTNTGKLTKPMFRKIFQQAKDLL
jgi:uracil-DNA glycosylase